MGFPLLDRAKAATVDFAAVTSPVYDRGGVPPSRGVTARYQTGTYVEIPRLDHFVFFGGRYRSPWAASTTGSSTIACSPPPSQRHRPAARRRLRAWTSRPQMLACANSSAGRQRLYRLTDLGVAQPLHHAGVDEKLSGDLGRHQATVGDHRGAGCGRASRYCPGAAAPMRTFHGPHRGQREGQPVDAGFPGVRDSEKPSSASADHEDDNDHDPSAQHRGRFMMWYSDIGDRGADLVEQTDVLCRERSCGPRLGFQADEDVQARSHRAGDGSGDRA